MVDAALADPAIQQSTVENDDSYPTTWNCDVITLPQIGDELGN